MHGPTYLPGATAPHLEDPVAGSPLDPRGAWRHALHLAAGLETLVAQLRTELGISSNEMNALLLLWDGGEFKMTELADRISLSRPAITTLVDRLEQGGWVERCNDARDRRQVIVAITDRFERAVAGASHAWQQRMRDHASATPSWPYAVEHAARLREIALESARELRDARRLSPRPAAAHDLP